jgi:hypothetical protein
MAAREGAGGGGGEQGRIRRRKGWAGGSAGSHCGIGLRKVATGCFGGALGATRFALDRCSSGIPEQGSSPTADFGCRCDREVRVVERRSRKSATDDRAGQPNRVSKLSGEISQARE